jgi:hypothetical protein
MKKFLLKLIFKLDFSANCQSTCIRCFRSFYLTAEKSCRLRDSIKFDNLLLIFLALEDAENVDPEEGGGGDEDNPEGGRHQEEVDVLNRHPKGAARLKNFVLR